MRVLLVIDTNKLAENLSALNPELKYSGIVVENVEIAKKTLADRDLSQVPLYPMSELKSCVEGLAYDYILCVQKWGGMKLTNSVKQCAVVADKVLSVSGLAENDNFLLERSLRYFKEHVAEFEMFSTGTSTVEKGINPSEFKRKLFNFGRGSQDLYYNLQVAKTIISYGEGNRKLRYALIGLAPYSFHYDLSKTQMFKYRMLQHIMVFNDGHNFFVPVEVYKKFFSKEWWTKKISFESFDVKSPHRSNWEKIMENKSMGEQAINAAAPAWVGKYYPETRDENIKILDDYLTLCEENNIRPVMFRVRVTEKYMANFNKRLLEEFYVLVEQACQKHPSAVFFDGWKLKDFTYADFFDHGHLNVHGAAKFSAYLNDFIEELEFNYYKDANNFHNRLNDSIEKFDFRNHFGA